MIDLIERENDKQISGFVSACLERFVSRLKQYRQSMHYYFFTLNHIDFDSHRRYSGLVEIVHMMHKKSLYESLLLIRMNNILWCEVLQSRTSLTGWITTKKYSQTTTGFIPYCRGFSVPLASCTGINIGIRHDSRHEFTPMTAHRYCFSLYGIHE